MIARSGLDRLIDAAQAAGAHPRPARGDEHRAVGICHGGSTIGSLVFYYDTTRGKARVKCFAGCEKDVILDALGLTREDWGDEPISWDGARLPRRVVTPMPTVEPYIFEPAPYGWEPPTDTWVPCGHTKSAEYKYRDEAGRILFGVARCSFKCFSQWRPVETRRGRRWRLTERDDRGRVIATVRYVPFRLPQLLAAVSEGRTIHVVEGEKDALAIVEAGGFATTGAGGAGKWRPEYNSFFTGADVVAVPDRDVPGRRHAEQLVSALLPVAERIRVAIAAAGKDAHDHLAAGHGLGDLHVIWTPLRTEHAR